MTAQKPIPRYAPNSHTHAGHESLAWARHYHPPTETPSWKYPHCTSGSVEYYQCSDPRGSESISERHRKYPIWHASQPKKRIDSACWSDLSPCKCNGECISGSAIDDIHPVSRSTCQSHHSMEWNRLLPCRDPLPTHARWHSSEVDSTPRQVPGWEVL